MQLKDKRIIVTGGTKGIGAATVRAYVREGAQVVFCGTNDERGKACEATANGQEGACGHAAYIRCNVGDQDDVNAFIAKAGEMLGGLDVLVNIAGIEANATAEDFPKETIDRLMNINFNGTVYTNQAAYKLMKKCGTVDGAIINFASDTGLSGMPNGAAYAASKAAVLAWTRTIAHEWGIESNVRCNCINPSIKTDMYAEWLKNADPSVVEPYLASIKNKFPIDGDMGDADKDCAPVMVFMASDASRYINGQIICINGGLVTVR